MKCCKCGAELLEGALFCSKCGTPVEQKLYCNKCGTELPSDAMFCHKCGTKVTNENSVASTQGSVENLQTKVGDIIKFGKYKYSVAISAEEWLEKTAPITWRVLDITDEGNLFVVSEEIIEKRAFNPWNADKRVSWEECELRGWLNNDFLNEAFNAQEQSRILAVNVKNSIEDNGLEDTIDKIFLLSTEEVEKYFVPDNPNNRKGTSKDRQCYEFHGAERTEAYNKYNGENEEIYTERWWLRTTYMYQNHLCYPCGVDYDGRWRGKNDSEYGMFGGDFFDTHDHYLGIRPAMVIIP